MIKTLILFLLISYTGFAANDMSISFINNKFDPLEESPKLRNVLTISETSGENYYILQFRGPIYKEWKEKIIKEGGIFHSYIPHFAYVVQMTPEEKSEIEKLSFVRWIGLFHPEYKIHPSVYETSYRKTENKLKTAKAQFKDGKVNIVSTEECNCGKDVLWINNDHLLQLSVRLFKGVSIDVFTEKLKSWSSDIQQIQENNNRIIVRIPQDSLNALARIPGVESVAKYAKKALSSSTWRYSVQVPRNTFTIEMDTDLSTYWDTVTNGTTLADKGVTGKGEIVTIFDTGLDYWSGFFQDPENDPPGSNHIALQGYTEEGGNLIEVASLNDPYGCIHGTNVASIVAGNPSIADNHPNGYNLMPIYDWGGQTRGNTVDYFPVKLYIQDFGYMENDTCKLGSFNMTTAMNKAYSTYNSRIHQNSWNYEDAPYAGEYIGAAIEVDNMVWQNKDFIVVFSAGNNGPGNTTVAPPATAKNCIAVGASWNPSFDTPTDSIASFSGRGWTTDGRIKPDVVAPGGSDPFTQHRHFIWGTGSHINWASDSAHTELRGMVGTSQAAPQISGACALIRQYFIDGFYPNGDTLSGISLFPSAALVKAVLISSTVDLINGNPVPDRAEGWGRVVLDNSLYFPGDSRVLKVLDHTLGVTTNDSAAITVEVINTSEPLKVVLVWSDTSATSMANPTLINDLDLIITAPNNNKYKGNVFSGGYSQTGGSADRLNNVEVVWLPNPTQSGIYTITVKGFNCPNGHIPFAVSAVGGFQGTPGIENPNDNDSESHKYITLKSPFVKTSNIQLNIINTSHVNLSIFDKTGRKIINLLEGKMEPGVYKTEIGKNLSSGIYFAVLEINGKKVEERKIIKIAK
jgi:hypothetical protein